MKKLRNLIKPAFRAYSKNNAYGSNTMVVSKKVNGLKVAGSLQEAKFGACTVMFKAGSRYESDEMLGVTHFLRVCSAGSGKNYTGYIKTRCLQQHGAYLTCTSDRQSICFTLRCPPPLFKDLKYYLVDATKNLHHQWELDENKKNILNDISRVTPEEKVLDLIQKASFTGGLANSVFCDEHQVELMSDKALKRFKDMHFGAKDCTVASTGLDFQDTILLADDIEIGMERNRACEVSIHRRGYESCCLGPVGSTWMAIAVPGCGTSDIRCLLTHAILAASCGTSSLQSGQHELDKSMEAPLGCLSRDLFTTHRAFNISYCDVGLFGILIKSKAETAREAACTAVDFFTNQIANISCEHIEVGIRRLKLNLNINQQNCVNRSEGLALELSSYDCVEERRDIMDLIDCIGADEVINLAKEIASKVCQLSFAVVGDLSSAPDDSELR